MICRDCLGIGHQTHNFLICWACGGSGIAYCCDGDQVSIETETSTCPYCGKDVLSYWAPREGCVPRPEYTLVANWIYHTKCWDKQVKERPPG